MNPVQQAPVLDGYIDGRYIYYRGGGDDGSPVGSVFYSIDATNALVLRARTILDQHPELVSVRLTATVPHLLMTAPIDEDPDHLDPDADGWVMQSTVEAYRPAASVFVTYYSAYTNESIELEFPAQLDK